MPINRDLKTSMEGDITTAAGNWFQIRIVVGKKLVEGLGIDIPSWNTELSAYFHVTSFVRTHKGVLCYVQS